MEGKNSAVEKVEGAWTIHVQIQFNSAFNSKVNLVWEMQVQMADMFITTTENSENALKTHEKRKHCVPALMSKLKQ